MHLYVCMYGANVFMPIYFYLQINLLYICLKKLSYDKTFLFFQDSVWRLL